MTLPPVGELRLIWPTVATRPAKAAPVPVPAANARDARIPAHALTWLWCQSRQGDGSLQGLPVALKTTPKLRALINKLVG